MLLKYKNQADGKAIVKYGLIFLILVNMTIAQVHVPLIMQQQSKIVPASLKIQKNFVQSDQDQIVHGLFEYYLKAPMKILYYLDQEVAQQCRIDLKTQQCTSQVYGFLFLSYPIPELPYILHTVQVKVPIYADQNPKKGDIWRFKVTMCEADDFFGDCDTITRFRFILPIM